jgi:hypothetical protein
MLLVALFISGAASAFVGGRLVGRLVADIANKTQFNSGTIKG